MLADPDEFTDRVGDFLLLHEAEHSLLFGILSNLSTGWSYGAGGPLFALVEDGAGIAAVGVRTPPRLLVLSRATEPQAVDALVAGVSNLGMRLPGVSGPAAESRQFAASWGRLHAEPVRRTVALQVYQASRIRPPQHPAPGKLRPAGAADTALVAGWIADFNEEAIEEDVSDRATALRMARDLVAHQGRSIYLWEDGEPVSMVATGRPSPNGGRVYAVYTPPAHRRKGYASTSVATLSQALLDSGLTSCFLLADVTKPTPNHIYREIGYAPVAFFDEYRFGD